jgi:hypothetical protein
LRLRPKAAVISARQTRVREALSAGMTVSSDFLTNRLVFTVDDDCSPNGSDIDIFFVLDRKYFHHYNNQNGGHAGLLDFAKRTLLNTYTRTPDISRNGQAVTIRFDDFVVDVVLGFHRQGGGYLIANSLSNSWLATDPKKHVDMVVEANKVQNGNFVPLVKMIKVGIRATARSSARFISSTGAGNLQKRHDFGFPVGRSVLFRQGAHAHQGEEPRPGRIRR